MIASLMLLAALQVEPRALRPSQAISESPQARAPVSSIDGSPPEGAGPRGTSGEQRYDAVGFAGIGDGAGDPQTITASTDALPQGSFVELTALDSGKTIVALVSGHGTGGGVVGLSPGAARLLGLDGGSTAVRVRGVTPTPQDQVALRSGRSAGSRLDAPPSLLTALRKRLPAGAPTRLVQRPQPITRPTTQPGASYAPPRDPVPLPEPARRPAPSYAPPRAAPAPAASGWYVQVAALSSLQRAQALAASLGGGRVVSNGGIHRVQIGPYGNAATAAQARDDAARRGYGGARVVHD
ncbi:MAG TPA: SPOR domain-containing protein [Sphingomonas sp.]|nr:SPOR domain-containing protein [Sphingomonas sp.]